MKELHILTNPVLCLSPSLSLLAVSVFFSHARELHRWDSIPANKSYITLNALYENNDLDVILQALTIHSSSGVRVKGLTIQNGQQMNFVIGRCDSVSVINVKVSAPEHSPNTDGIHITESTNVVLQNCKIGTGYIFLILPPTHLMIFTEKNFYPE